MFILSYLAFFSTVVSAQTDDQLWLSSGIRYRPKKKIRVDVTQHLRMDQDISRIGSVITEAGISKSFKSGIRIGSAYRFQMSSKRKVQLEPRHRIDLYGRYKNKIGPLAFAYRLQFQEKFEGDDEQPWSTRIRNRLGVEYDTDTRFSPGISAEIFTDIGSSGPFSKWRATSALEYKLSKRHLIEGYVRAENSLADESLPLERIVGFDYQYRIPRKKKKK